MSNDRPPSGMPQPGCLGTFEAAGEAVLKFLHERLGFQTWMLTRTEGNACIVLQAEDHGYGVKSGQIMRWDESFCARMVSGEGPRFAPRAGEIPAYANAPIGKQVRINAYLGVPLMRQDGTLFGTLHAMDMSQQPDRIGAELPLVELLASMLCSVLDHEMAAAEQARLVERERAISTRDALTGLYNRRGWDDLLCAEEARCRRYGHPACIVSIDLDGLKSINDNDGHAAGDRLIRQAARAIESAARDVDVPARVGGDEFQVLLVECGQPGGEAFFARLREAFDVHQVRASIGLAVFNPSVGITAAVDEADGLMYADKRARRSQSPYPIAKRV